MSAAIRDRARRTRPRGARALLAAALAAGVTALAAGGASGMAAAEPPARAARTITLNDTGRLHLTSHRGFTLNEVGTATGSIRGPLYLHLHVVSTNRVTAEVNVYPANGSLTALASAAYATHGATASFSGTMSVLRGSGVYRRARGTGLSFSGTIARSNDAVTVHVSGRLGV